MRKLVDKIKKRFRTADPFEIAKILDITVFYEDLGNSIYGYYLKSNRIKTIVLNKNNPPELMKFTMAHELGHAIIHSDINTPALSKITLVSELKIERQANEFATLLLIDGSHEEYNIVTKQQFLLYYGIPSNMERFLPHNF